MKVLVSGLTGQLGCGLVESSAERHLQLIPLMRASGSRPVADRLRRLFGEPQMLGAPVIGDVCSEAWGLGEAGIRRLAPQVNTIVNLAADTNWASPQRRLHAVNVIGALAGYELTRKLQTASGSRKTYIHASTIHAVGDLSGWIAEQPFPVEADRTAYEHSKWVAERLLLEQANQADAPALLIARIGGLVGSAKTGATTRRNSLYVLADRWDELPLHALALCRRGRVDMLPRDVAGGMIVDLIEAAERKHDAPAEIVHACAGESAPTAEAVIAALRSLDILDQRSRVTTVPMPMKLLTTLSRQLERVERLHPNLRNALIAMRYLAFDRMFERDRLAARLPGPPPAVTAEEIVRLTFALPRLPLSEAPDDRTFARFAG